MDTDLAMDLFFELVDSGFTKEEACELLEMDSDDSAISCFGLESNRLATASSDDYRKDEDRFHVAH